MAPRRSRRPRKRDRSEADRELDRIAEKKAKDKKAARQGQQVKPYSDSVQHHPIMLEPIGGMPASLKTLEAAGATHVTIEYVLGEMRNIAKPLRSLVARKQAGGHDIAAALRAFDAAVERLESAFTPYSLCAECKGYAELKDECIGCGGSGWASYARLQKLPNHLFAHEERCVTVHGVVRPVSEASKHLGKKKLTRSTFDF